MARRISSLLNLAGKRVTDGMEKGENIADVKLRCNTLGDEWFVFCFEGAAEMSLRRKNVG